MRVCACTCVDGCACVCLCVHSGIHQCLLKERKRFPPSSSLRDTVVFIRAHSLAGAQIIGTIWEQILFFSPQATICSYVKAAENGFYQVIYNGNTGYALASYLSATKPSVSTSNNTVSYETYYVVNCKQSITLRPQPDVNSGEICQIPLGAAVSFISTASNGFYYISYNGNTGYSLASYLSSSSGNSSYSTCRVVNCNESITLRPQPDVNSGEICQIPLGETVSYIGTAENGFYEIYYMGNHGYSLADYLEFE